MTDGSENRLWEDRVIKFDVPNVQKHLRGGERVLMSLDHVEDTKGNPGDIGRLLISNLRVIWYSLEHKSFNLTIGFSRIVTISTKTVLSNLRGTTQALYILGAGVNMKFEFLFTDMSTNRNHELSFVPVFEIYKIYQRTHLYRELKLRGGIVHGGNLIVLPQEQVYNTISGVWNLSSDQGNLGSFIITNIRLVWFADINETFNISLPYLQMLNIKIRESKYGPALVIQTMDTAGGYVLGFRIDPSERLVEIYKELTSLNSVYREKPDFGVYYTLKNSYDTAELKNDIHIDEFEEIDQNQNKEISTKFNSYLAEGTISSRARPPFYCKEIGFAMEKIRDGYTLSDLWEVVAQKNKK